MECEKCGKQEMCCQGSGKSTHRTELEKKNLIKRLNIIEGQVRGISQMIENDRYCADILVQIAAVNNSLKSLGNHVLENHLKTCVAYDIQMGNLDILDDVMKLIKKLQ